MAGLHDDSAGAPPAGAEDELEFLRARLARLERVAAASLALHGSLNLREVLRQILAAAAAGVAAERGTVFLFTDDRSELWSEVLSGDEHLDIRLPAGQGIAGLVAATGKVLRIRDAYADPRFDRGWDVRAGFRTRQILCAPIRNRDGQILGCFQLLNKRSGEFTAEDEEFLDSLSIHAAIAVENARLHASSLERERQSREISLAREVQRQIQPERRAATLGGLSAAALNELCEDASGDYYDILTDLPDGRMAVALGDACGHGLQAALLMAEARALLRAFFNTVPELARSMRLLNDLLAPDISDGRFISMFAAQIDPADGNLEWCNAGHCPPQLLRAATGAFEELSRTGVVLGAEHGSTFARGANMALEPGDLLLIFSDGITEAESPAGEPFGLERLRAMMRSGAHQEPADLLEDLRAAAHRWTGGARNSDDLTILAVRREPAPGRIDPEYATFFDLAQAGPERARQSERDFRREATALLVRLGAEPGAAAAAATRLWERMAAPGRSYHSPIHVLGILAIADQVRAPLTDADRLALWFHDAILDPQLVEGENERASAAWLLQIGAELRLDPRVCALAADSINWTAHHHAPEVPEEHRMMLDLDLANLGAPPEVFDRQSEAVVAELQHLAPQARLRASLDFFTALSRRDAVYRTPSFGTREAAARANLERAIERLQRQLGAS